MLTKEALIMNFLHNIGRCVCQQPPCGLIPLGSRFSLFSLKDWLVVTGCKALIKNFLFALGG